MQVKRPFERAARNEAVLGEEIGDRDRPLMLDIGVAADDAMFVERNLGDALLAARHCQLSPRLRRMAIERAWASSPSASASVIAAGPIALRLAGSQPSSEVRFMKSSTPRPEEKRAL